MSHLSRPKVDLMVSMTLTGSDSLKALVACFHFLHKVGKDLLLEVDSDVLVLRALNEAKTAYASMEFDSRFFSDGLYKKDGIESFSCKVSLKQLCAVCKSFRNVEKLTIRAEKSQDDYDLVLQMHSSSTGIVRTHKFKYSDCDVLSAVFNETGVSTLKAAPKVFSQILSCMYQSPEIAIEAMPSEFKVRSYHAPSDQDQPKHLDTDLNIDIEDFDFYDCKPMDLEERFTDSNADDTGYDQADNAMHPSRAKKELIFCVKELRAILHLCESVSFENLQMSFSTPGMPMKLQATKEHFTAQAIVTTIIPRAATSSSSHNAAISSSSTQNSERSKKRGSQDSLYDHRKQNKQISQSNSIGRGLDGNEGEQSEEEEEEEIVRRKRRTSRCRVEDDED